MVARAVDADTQSKLYQVGADHVISRNIIEGLRMASVMLRPTVVSFLEVMTLGEDIDLFLEEVLIGEKDKLKDKTLVEAKIPQEIGLIVIAIRKNEGKFLYNPKSDTLLEVGDALIVLGKPSQVDQLKIYLLKGKVTKFE
jgi:voltage-gated potassium channel